MSFRPQFEWKLRTRSLGLGGRTLLLGIVNVTPDSFSDGGRYLAPEAAVEHGLRLLDEGADVLDVGAESTRPGATGVGADEEQARLLPVVEELLRARPGVVLSVDTYHAATAAAAVGAGAEIVNDVSGLLWDESMAGTLGGLGVGAILMHTRGRPGEWATLPALGADEVMRLVRDGLARVGERAESGGIGRARVVLDPGFGFGKAGAANFTLLARFAELRGLGYPLLAGVSRKRFLTAGLVEAGLGQARLEAARLEATSAAHVAAILAGAHLLRVHDVAAARVTAAVADAVLAAG